MNDIFGPSPESYEPPEDDWGICPTCGCGQEDAEPHGESYLCPECGLSYSNDDAHPDPRDDEPILEGD